MVMKNSSAGLIATTRTDISPPLNDLIACCGWPLVLEARPRRLARELALHNPSYVLFWLDNRQSIAATARLITWSRERGHRPYRVTVAYRMEADVEAVFRAAGAHSFFQITDCLGDKDAALWPLLKDPACLAFDPATHVTPFALSRDHAMPLKMSTDLVRPP
jgi:hypothetical protein